MPLRRDRTPRMSAGDELQNVQSAVDLVLRRLVGTRDPEYEDLQQSSMENVLTTFDRGKFRGDCPAGGWAAVIARNVAVDAIRVRKRERKIFAHEEAERARAEQVRDPGADPRPRAPHRRAATAPPGQRRAHAGSARTRPTWCSCTTSSATSWRRSRASSASPSPRPSRVWSAGGVNHRQRRRPRITEPGPSPVPASAGGKARET